MEFNLFHHLLLVGILFSAKFYSCTELQYFQYTDGPSANPQSDEASEALSCPREFQGKCFCGQNTNEASPYRGSKIVTCNNYNLTSTLILGHLPNWTEVVVYTGNSLKDGLPSNIFNADGKRSFDRLHVIDLSNNELTSIHPRAFWGLKNVSKLILDHNRLMITGEHFHPRIFSYFNSLEELHLKSAFAPVESQKGTNFIEDLVTTLDQANLRKLKILNLEGNSIQSIVNEFAFCSLPSLTKLLLAGNVLSTFSINVSCNPKLYLLDISDNYISSLSNKSLALFRNEPKFHVNLTRNPLKCDCRIADLYRWIKRTQTWVIGNKTLQCASGYPESNIGKLFVSLHISDLQCSSSLDDDEVPGFVTASFAIVISLILAIVVMLIALLVAHKEHVTKFWARISSTFSDKQEYTALQQEQHHTKIHQVQPIANATMTAAHLVHHHYHNVIPQGHQAHHFNHHHQQQHQQVQVPQVHHQQQQQQHSTHHPTTTTTTIRSVAPGVEEVSV